MEIVDLYQFNNNTFNSISNILYVFSTNDYDIVNKYQLDSNIHIMDFAVGTNSLLLYGHNGTGNNFIVIDKINGSIEIIKTNIRVDELFNYNENEVLMHVNSDSSSDSYFTSYNINNDDTFSLQYKSNATSVISAAWDNIGKNIIFSNYDNITKTYYLKSLNTESGLICTLDMSGGDVSHTVFDNISISSNILVWSAGSHTLLYYDTERKL